MTKPLAKLKIVKPEALASAFDIPAEGLTIGNDASAQLYVHDPNILSGSGKVIPTDGTYYLSITSEAPVRLNGQVLNQESPYPLTHGDDCKWGIVS
ncbi:MAG: hypothetical protein HC810_05990 [Acaryochloridaceae cyanobacterium RL_2_7]|nr:hypothetical protein [Acaryochloridaceae cyanobacterium RL_2_7]